MRGHVGLFVQREPRDAKVIDDAGFIGSLRAVLDPGLDDLLAEWSFGDGTPGASTAYPLPAIATRGSNRRSALLSTCSFVAT